jgi:hypothetical protein
LLETLTAHSLYNIAGGPQSSAAAKLSIPEKGQNERKQHDKIERPVAQNGLFLTPWGQPKTNKNGPLKA